MHIVYNTSENSKTVQVLDLVSTHSVCFGGSYLVLTSFAYVLLGMNSFKSHYFVALYMYYQPYNMAQLMSLLDWT